MIKYSKARFDDLNEARLFVRRNEAEFDQKLTSVIRQVIANNSSRIITLTGPTCSGKTTTAKKSFRPLLSARKG
jgi:flagellar biosynthesis GTPase FlhF